jgi:hypothetical protein
MGIATVLLAGGLAATFFSLVWTGAFWYRHKLYGNRLKFGQLFNHFWTAFAVISFLLLMALGLLLNR